MDTSSSELQELRRLVGELTARVFRLERALNLPAAACREPASTAEAPTSDRSWRRRTRSLPTIPQPAAASSIRKSRARADLESRIGSHWLNRIGIAAVLIGVSYFLKFAFDNNWIGPAGRVAIGLLAGIAIVVWSENFRRRGYVIFSYSLKAVGIGVLYLSLYAAFQVYSLVTGGVAFSMMFAVTAATAVMAWTQDAEILAAFALVGGFATPLLLSTGQNREVALFTYVVLLDAGALALVILKPWRRLLLLSYAGTLLLYVGWYASFYDVTQVRMTVGFATLFFAIFAVAPLLARPAQKGWLSDSVPPLVAVVNAAGYFLQIYVMFEEIGTKDTAWFALALAALVHLPQPPGPGAGGQSRGGADRGPAAPGAGHRIYYGGDSHTARRPLDHHGVVRGSGGAVVGRRPDSLGAAQHIRHRRPAAGRGPASPDR